MVQLEKEHEAEIEEDASDRIWMLFGSANHYVLEKTKTEGDFLEQRLFMDVGGHKISGQFDRLTWDGVLVDFKFTSVWAAIDMNKNGTKKDWEAQLNMLAALIREHPSQYFPQHFPQPKALRLMIACRDWRESESKRMEDYPPKVFTIEVKMWPHEQAMAFIQERVRLHTQPYIPCTDEERWAKPGVFAVMSGKKKADRLLPTRAEAEEWAKTNQLAKFEIVERPTTYTRCEGYCSAAPFCQQFTKGTTQ
ncbi:MAG: hypothetical protein ACYC9L_16135 [Sulfuricaulis sp.]